MAIDDIGGETVPMGEITGRSKLIADRVRNLARQLGENPVERRLEPELVELAREIEPRVPGVGIRLAAAPSLTTLDGMRTEWEALGDRISSREERLRRRVDELEREIAQLEDVRELWARTVTRARARVVPPGIVEAAEAAYFEIERVIESAQGTLNDVLILQSQFAELNWTIRDTLDLIDATRERIVANILVRDEVSIWADAPFEAAGTAATGGTGRVVASARDYAQKHPDRVALHALFFLLLAWLIRRARRSIEPRAAQPVAEASGDRIREVLTDTPYAARVVFLVEMAVGVVLLLWILRSARLEKLPASAGHNRWLSAVGIWVRIAAGAMCTCAAWTPRCSRAASTRRRDRSAWWSPSPRRCPLPFPVPGPFPRPGRARRRRADAGVATSCRRRRRRSPRR